MIQRTIDMVEADGGRVLKVNPAYTSQKCHRCDSQMDMSDNRRPRCLVCQVTWDRDENASINIARRAQHSKACQTRKKRSSKNRRRNSKGVLCPLKHPLKKTEPTPKAPQNRPRSNHMVEHSKRFRYEKHKGGVTTRTMCAVGWLPVAMTGVSVPTVGSSYEDVQTTSRTTIPCSTSNSRGSTFCGDTKV